MSPTMASHSEGGPPDSIDIEKDAESSYAHLTNTSIQTFSWENVTVTVKDRQTKQPKDILSGVNGIVKAGRFPLFLHRSWLLMVPCRRSVGSHGAKWFWQDHIA